MSNENRDTKTN